MKKYKYIISSFLLCISIIFSCGFVQAEEQENKSFIVTNCKDDNAKQILWDYLIKYAPNDYAAAGMLGMMYRESQFQSNAFGGWHNWPVNNYDGDDSIFQQRMELLEEKTAEIDTGLLDGSTYEKFKEETILITGGYGLCQWWSDNYVEQFYKYAQEWGTSISDAEMQCAYTFWYIKEYKTYLWEQLNNVNSPKRAGELIGIFYDGTPAYESIGQFADQFYNELVNKQVE